MFEKQRKCQSVKIWSRDEMNECMMLLGWSAFNQFNRDLESGAVSGKDGCVYSNDYYTAYARKTKSGMCTVRVSESSNQLRGK